MTSFTRLHHVRLKTFVHFVVKMLLLLISRHVVIVVVVLNHRIPRRMRQRADTIARVINVREIVALLISADAVWKSSINRLWLGAAGWCIWCTSLL